MSSAYDCERHGCVVDESLACVFCGTGLENAFSPATDLCGESIEWGEQISPEALREFDRVMAARN